MEKEVLKVVKKSISEAIITSLTKYDSPLKKITDNVINDNADELYSLINDEFSSMLYSGDFKESLTNALHTKLAQVLISRMGGDLEKKVNELKSNPATKVPKCG